MSPLTLLGRYFAWHYTAGLLDCLRLLGDFLWFTYHFFSVPVVGRTLLAPWRRLGESYRGGLDPQRMLETFIVNILMRLVGFGVRIILLIAAGLSLIGVLALGLLMIIIFFFAPVIILSSFSVGFYLLFLT